MEKMQPKPLSDEDLEAFRDSVLDEKRAPEFTAEFITKYGRGEFPCKREWIAQSFGAIVAEALRGDFVRPHPDDLEGVNAQTHGFYGWLAETTTTVWMLASNRRPKPERAEVMAKAWYYGAAGVLLHQASWDMLTVERYDLVDMHEALVAIMAGRS